MSQLIVMLNPEWDPGTEEITSLKSNQSESNVDHNEYNCIKIGQLTMTIYHIILQEVNRRKLDVEYMVSL